MLRDHYFLLLNSSDRRLRTDLPLLSSFAGYIRPAGFWSPFIAADKVAFADGELFGQKFNCYPLPDIRFDKSCTSDSLVRMIPPPLKNHKRQLSVLADIELAYSGS